MANIKAVDADGTTVYLKADGAGDNGDPNIPYHKLTGSLPDTSGGALAAIKTAVEAIQTAVEILDNIVAGSEAQVDVVSAAMPTPPSRCYAGTITVAAAGTPVQASQSASLSHGMTVKAKAANAGTVYVGHSNVGAATSIHLAPGEEVFVAVDDRQDIWIDAVNNGDGVSFIAS